jgi:hypothetical protein
VSVSVSVCACVCVCVCVSLCVCVCVSVCLSVLGKAQTRHIKIMNNETWHHEEQRKAYTVVKDSTFTVGHAI